MFTFSPSFVTLTVNQSIEGSVTRLSLLTADVDVSDRRAYNRSMTMVMAKSKSTTRYCSGGNACLVLTFISMGLVSQCGHNSLYHTWSQSSVWVQFATVFTHHHTMLEITHQYEYSLPTVFIPGCAILDPNILEKIKHLKRSPKGPKRLLWYT
jgi:hypothetical protein